MRTKGLLVGMAALLAVSMSACGAGKKSSSTPSGSASGGSGAPTQTGKPITIGTTDQVIALDPAGSYDNGSLLLEENIYQFLMNVPAGAKKPAPDAAKSCSFTSGTVYTCTLKPNQKFSNGDVMTAKDVVFSYQRVININNPNGPASLLSNMKSVKATGPLTVAFTLKEANDQTWPFVLGTSAGPIVDSKVFPAKKLLDDAKVIGSGPYALKSYSKNQLVSLQANPNYNGANKPKTSTITLKYYTQSTNMKLDVQSGAIDIAWRSLTPTDVASLKKVNSLKVLAGAGGEIRYLVFNLKTMPGGTDAKKLAIRKAVAYSVDRSALANDVFQGTYQPLYSMIPQGVADATQPFKSAFGTSPNKAKAAAALQSAGVSTPVSLNIEYTTDHYGPVSDQEYNEIKRQLEATGLFKVTLGSAAYTTYSPERVKDTYPIYQLGWFPDFVDADNYLSPFLVENNFVFAHYCDVKKTNRPCDKDKVLPLLAKEKTTSGAARTQILAKIQSVLATGELPYVPLLQGKMVAVTAKNISGVQETLDPTYQFRFWLFSKS